MLGDDKTVFLDSALAVGHRSKGMVGRDHYCHVAVFANPAPTPAMAISLVTFLKPSFSDELIDIPPVGVKPYCQGVAGVSIHISLNDLSAKRLAHLRACQWTGRQNSIASGLSPKSFDWFERTPKLTGYGCHTHVSIQQAGNFMFLSRRKGVRPHAPNRYISLAEQSANFRGAEPKAISDLLHRDAPVIPRDDLSSHSPIDGNEGRHCS